jgi:hypothetical protein
LFARLLPLYGKVNHIGNESNLGDHLHDAYIQWRHVLIPDKDIRASLSQLARSTAMHILIILPVSSETIDKYYRTSSGGSPHIRPAAGCMHTHVIDA